MLNLNNRYYSINSTFFSSNVFPIHHTIRLEYTGSCFKNINNESTISPTSFEVIESLIDTDGNKRE